MACYSLGNGEWWFVEKLWRIGEERVVGLKRREKYEKKRREREREKTRVRVV